MLFRTAIEISCKNFFFVRIKKKFKFFLYDPRNREERFYTIADDLKERVHRDVLIVYQTEQKFVIVTCRYYPIGLSTFRF